MAIKSYNNIRVSISLNYLIRTKLMTNKLFKKIRTQTRVKPCKIIKQKDGLEWNTNRHRLQDCYSKDSSLVQTIWNSKEWINWVKNMGEKLTIKTHLYVVNNHKNISWMSNFMEIANMKSMSMLSFKIKAKK